MEENDPEQNNSVRIEGITNDGKTFRPSNWAERVSETLATFKNGRFKYSPMLTPIVENNNKCVMIDNNLKSSNPELYADIINFAKQNNLKICGEENEDSSD